MKTPILQLEQMSQGNPPQDGSNLLVYTVGAGWNVIYYSKRLGWVLARQHEEFRLAIHYWIYLSYG